MKYVNVFVGGPLDGQPDPYGIDGDGFNSVVMRWFGSPQTGKREVYEYERQHQSGETITRIFRHIGTDPVVDSDHYAKRYGRSLFSSELPVETK